MWPYLLAGLAVGWIARGLWKWEPAPPPPEPEILSEEEVVALEARREAFLEAAEKQLKEADCYLMNDAGPVPARWAQQHRDQAALLRESARLLAVRISKAKSLEGALSEPEGVLP